jgi:hypothetical protein
MNIATVSRMNIAIVSIAIDIAATIVAEEWTMFPVGQLCKSDYGVPYIAWRIK